MLAVRTLPLFASLSRWYHAIGHLAPEIIGLPALVVPNQEQELAAFYGDKLLGAAVAGALLKHLKASGQESRHMATVLASVALSNSFLARNVHQILPEFLNNNLLQVSDHRVGTMVEVAVAAVHAKDDGAEAVHDLATWLVREASMNPDPNAKGRLLNLGGTVESIQVSGTDHQPVFHATAELQGRCAFAHGHSKKQAEQLAAAGLFTDMEYNVVEREVLDLSPACNVWNPFFFPLDHRLELKGGETIREWWSRGALRPQDSFRRAMMAPEVFPDQIVAVDSWTRRTEEDDESPYAAVMMVITSRSSQDVNTNNGMDLEFSYVPVQISKKSATSARKAMGIEANRIIAKLVSVPLPSE